ncbi:polyisoprenoid-binding protein YceI [Flavobacterium sp. CG_9.1]|nr:polyisoprenoid-binding protein YceI [Flavobacterium sp. CG_9.1]
MSTTKWVIDPTHSEIGFKVKHMMFTNVSGKFSKFDANIEAEDNNLENAKIEFT